MSTTKLGKRKRSQTRISSTQLQQPPSSSAPPTSAPFEDQESEVESEDEQDQEDVQDIFRRAFERRFAPLAQGAARHKGNSTNRIRSGIGETRAEIADEDVDEEEEEGVWNGLDDSDDSHEGLEVHEAPVEVVDYSSNGLRDVNLEGLNMAAGRSEAKKFMSSKPPTFSSTLTSSKTRESAAAATEDDDEDTRSVAALDTANDLALHRLISESHLLSSTSTTTTSSSPSTFSHQNPTTSTTSPHPKTPRHHQTDLRLRSLGAKHPLSTLTTGKIPLAHATGIARKKVEKEQRRRREAREAGVVLEREGRGAKKGAGGVGGGRKKRERGVGGAGVGRFRGGGTLVLGRGDVKGILGGGGGSGGGGRKSGGGGRNMKRR